MDFMAGKRGIWWTFLVGKVSLRWMRSFLYVGIGMFLRACRFLDVFGHTGWGGTFYVWQYGTTIYYDTFQGYIGRYLPLGLKMFFSLFSMCANVSFLQQQPWRTTTSFRPWRSCTSEAGDESIVHLSYTVRSQTTELTAFSKIIIIDISNEWKTLLQKSKETPYGRIFVLNIHRL